MRCGTSSRHTVQHPPFHTASIVPDSCREFAATVSAARFCVGREVHGLPVGAYVHAARNQFAHWGDEIQFDASQHKPAGLDRFTQGVFDHLQGVYGDDPLTDLVFELGNHFYGGTAIRAADVVLSVLRWTDYDKYVSDIVAMIGTPE